MGIKGYRYNRFINVPRRWQEYIYAISKLYDDDVAYAEIIDRAIVMTDPNYIRELRRIVVRGESTTKVGKDYAISDKTLQRRVRKYYENMYRILRRI